MANIKECVMFLVLKLQTHEALRLATVSNVIDPSQQSSCLSGTYD